MNVSSLRNNKLAILLFSFVMLIAYTPQAFAQKGNKKDLENKKKKLKEEINTINDLLHETKSSKKISMNQVAILNKKISVREELISTIKYEIHLINKQINENQTTINNLNSTFDKLRKDYAAMVYFDYRNSDACGLQYSLPLPCRPFRKHSAGCGSALRTSARALWPRCWP